MRNIQFENFKNHQAYFFICCFINVINNINVLSLCYDRKFYQRYEDNLNAIRKQLLKILSILIHGIADEGDIYQMCYTIKYNKYQPLDIPKLMKYDKKNTLDSLILRNFDKGKNVNLDENRISSIKLLIEIIEDVDNLLKRATHLSELELSGLTELSDVKRIVFNYE